MRSFFVNMKISTKLLMFSLLTVMLLASLSFSAFIGLSKQEKLTDSVFSESFQCYVVSTNLIDGIKDFNIKAYNALNMANVGYPDEEIEAAAKPLPDEIESLEKQITDELDSLGESDQLFEVYTKTLEDFIKYKKLMLQVISAVTFDTDVAFASLSSAEQFYKKLNIQLVKLKQLEIANMESKRTQVGNLVSSISRNMIIFSVVIAFVTLLLGFIMSQSIIRPVKRLMEFAHGLSGGNLALRFESKADDEIGQLGSIMNVMAEQVEESMDNAQQKAADAEQEAKAAQAAEKRAGDMAEQAESQKQNILEAAGQLEEMAQDLKDSASELSERTAHVSRAVGEQRDRFAETATAITEMSATAISIAGNAEDASSEADQATSEAADGVKSLQGVIAGIGRVKTNSEGLKVNMNELADYVKEIGNIMGIISDIADQTNLLALNAAIEAARAGEAGRGFAVVADEVRKLAEKTMSATTDVGKNISSIQDSSKRSSAATDEALKAIIDVNEMAGGSGDVLKGIVRSVQMASDGIHTIATAAEEQSATTEEITRATDDVNALTSTISDEMERTDAATNQVAELAEKLHRFVEQIRNT